MRGFGKPVMAAHELFAADADPIRARRAWEAWLSQAIAPALTQFSHDDN